VVGDDHADFLLKVFGRHGHVSIAPADGPWATREERIYELEKLLDREDVDEADLVVTQDQLHPRPRV
jgi:hypothetical protein